MSRETGFLEIGDDHFEIVTLDFETYYDVDYTLSGKINTSEYIRSPRFHAHGVGIKIGNGKTLWYTGKNIKLALKAIDWKKSAMLGHNTPFDGFICSHHYGIVPAFYLDTLSMSRAAHGHHQRHDLDSLAKAHGRAGKVKRDALANTKGKTTLTPEESMALGGYCVDDVDDTYGVFWDMHPHLPDDELNLIDITVRMFCDPVLRVDIPRVQTELEKEVGAKVGALLRSGVGAEELMSNHKFAALLGSHNCPPPMKISPTTGLRTYAFARNDLGFQQLMHHPDKTIRDLVEARIAIKSTIGETRAIRFIEAGKDNMPLPILLHYSGAHTHRWSGGNKMNLQNLKRDSELRRSIIAPKGQSIVVVDSAQIEARVLAWLANQTDVIAAFANKRDLYSEFASDIFGYPVDRKCAMQNPAGQYVDEQNRVVGTKAEAFFPYAVEGFVGKVCILGLGYGMGWEKFQKTLASGAMGMTVELRTSQCKAAVNLYRGRNHKIVGLWKAMDGIITSMFLGHSGEHGPLKYGKGFIQLPNGLFLHYYGLHGEVYEDPRSGNLRMVEANYLTRNGRAKIYGGLLTENVVQALARCIIAEQMLKISKKYRIVTMTHDEIVVVCPTSKADKCLKEMLEIMSTPPDWAAGLPLAAEGGHDVNYSK